MRGKKALLMSLALTTVFASSAAFADETITYTYDARGRLVKVVHTGTSNNNNQACYTYDKADNRTNVKVSVGTTPLPSCP